MSEREPESPADGAPALRATSAGARSSGSGSGESSGESLSRGTSGARVTECSETLLRIFEFLDGEMTPDDCARIRAHLDECGPCLHEYQVDQALKAVIKRSCACEAAPVELRTTILRRLTVVSVDSADWPAR